MTSPLYCDHDSSDDALVRQLRIAGFDVLTADEAGNRELSDPEQLAFATREGRALYTANKRDFAPLHTHWMTAARHHAGIILRVEQRADVGRQLRALSAVFERYPDGLADQLIWV